MITYDEFGDMLDELAAGFPEVFYEELNGGIVLLPDTMYHPESREGGELYIMGEYHCQPHGLGRYIVIYYGSFAGMYGGRPRSVIRAELRRTLSHEFTHHMESLAGERGLEIKDRENLDKYKRRYED